MGTIKQRRVRENLTEEERQRLAQRIRDARYTWHISQQTVANKMGCSRDPIARAELAQRKELRVYQRILNAIADIVAERKAEENQRYIASLRQTASLGVPA